MIKCAKEKRNYDGRGKHADFYMYIAKHVSSEVSYIPLPSLSLSLERERERERERNQSVLVILRFGKMERKSRLIFIIF